MRCCLCAADAQFSRPPPRGCRSSDFFVHRLPLPPPNGADVLQSMIPDSIRLMMVGSTTAPRRWNCAKRSPFRRSSLRQRCRNSARPSPKPNWFFSPPATAWSFNAAAKRSLRRKVWSALSPTFTASMPLSFAPTSITARITTWSGTSLPSPARLTRGSSATQILSQVRQAYQRACDSGKRRQVAPRPLPAGTRRRQGRA